MRKARPIALMTGASVLTAAFVAAMTTSAPAALAARTTPAAPVIRMSPGIIQLPQAKARATPWTTALCESLLSIACYDPNQLRAAYNVAPLYAQGITGAGKTIVIVDSFGSPTIQNDLSVFDKQFGYPDPPSFKIITPAGPVTTEDPGWAGETTLDVEYAHTLAPGANILLVETPDAETEGVTGFPNIVKSEQYVIDHHLGDVIAVALGPRDLVASRGPPLGCAAWVQAVPMSRAAARDVRGRSCRQACYPGIRPATSGGDGRRVPRRGGSRSCPRLAGSPGPGPRRGGRPGGARRLYAPKGCGRSWSPGRSRLAASWLPAHTAAPPSPGRSQGSACPLRGRLASAARCRSPPAGSTTLSATVRSSSGLKNWKIIPTCRRR